MKNCFLIISVAAIVITGCTKPSDCDDHYFSDNYKSYVYSNSGSYWIYKDSTMNITDSVYLISQTIGYDDACSPSNQPHEFLIDTLYSSYFKDGDNHIWIGRGRADARSYTTGLYLGDYFSEGTFIDSILVQEIWYKDIMKFDVNNGDSYYWAKDIGLIKKEFNSINTNDYYSFELVKHHLN